MSQDSKTVAGRWSGTESANEHIIAVLDATAEVRSRIATHEMYQRLDTLEAVRVFMENHVFAVLDFMWILKSLQQTATCVDVPWLPPPNRDACRFLNELVLGEESDEWKGGWSSHFEIYLEAMTQAGADRSNIDRYLELLRVGEDPTAALDQLDGHESPKSFVRTSLTFTLGSESHERAAAFAFGREELIPAMFTELLETIRRSPDELSILGEYLSRHIDLDGEIHTPLAFDLVTSLCDGNEKRWAETTTAAISALEARLALWDNIVNQLDDSEASRIAGETLSSPTGNHRAGVGRAGAT